MMMVNARMSARSLRGWQHRGEQRCGERAKSGKAALGEADENDRNDDDAKRERIVEEHARALGAGRCEGKRASASRYDRAGGRRKRSTSRGG